MVGYRNTRTTLPDFSTEFISHSDGDDRVLRLHEVDLAVHAASVAQVRQPLYRNAMGRWKKWELYIQALLDEVGELEERYWNEPDAL